MHVAVIGAGAIGGTIAALLHRAGHSVEVTARGEHLRAIQRSGIRLSGAWGDHTADVTAAATLTRTPDLAVLSTKAMDAAAAASENAATIDAAPLVVVQNGLGGLEAVSAELPRSPIIGALSLIAASLTAPGAITVTTAAGTWLGMANPDEPDAPAHAAAGILAQAIPCEVVGNFAGARWTKLLVNQVNALPAITGLSVQAAIEHPGLRRLMAASMQETARVGLAHGIRFEEVQGITHADAVHLAESPDGEADFVALRLHDYLGDVPNPGSTLQSIRRGQATEIDYLNGAVVDAARRVGVATPVNRMLVELVHDVERSGAHLDPETVLARA